MAQDIVDKRRNMATKTMQASITLLQALSDFTDVKDESAILSSGFSQSDFDGTSLKHIHVDTMNAMLDETIATLIGVLDADSGRVGQNLRKLLP